MRATIIVTTDELEELVYRHFEEKVSGNIDRKSIRIEVKTTQNFKAEWEVGNFRAVYEGELK